MVCIYLHMQIKQMKTTDKKMSGVSEVIRTATPNGAKTVSVSKGAIVKLNAIEQAETIQKRMQKIAELNRKTTQLFKLRENQRDLEAFNTEGDKIFDCVKITDAEGKDWRTSNSFLLKRIVDVMLEEFNQKTTQIEVEILSASI
jgi:hypothetical protein